MNGQLDSFLHKNIPITSAMGIETLCATKQRVVLKAPIKNNINHKSTAFGGSLHGVATLACWSLLHLNLDPIYQGKIQIVIADSTINYLVPVTADFLAECSLPDEKAWKRFLLALDRKKMGRISLESKISCKDTVCVNFTGTFAAIITNG